MENNFEKVRFTDDYVCNDGRFHQAREVKYTGLQLNSEGKVIIPEGTIALLAEGENNLLGFDADFNIEVNPEEIKKHTEKSDDIIILSNKRFEEFRNSLPDVFFKTYDYYIELRNFITNRTDSHDSFTLELYTKEHRKALDEIINRMELNTLDKLALYYKFERNCNEKESAENAGISTGHLKTILAYLSLTGFTPMKYYAIGEYAQVKNDEEWIRNLFYQQKQNDGYNDHSDDILRCDVRTLYYEGLSAKSLKIIIGKGIENIRQLDDVFKRHENACCTYEELEDELGKDIKAADDIIGKLKLYA